MTQPESRRSLEFQRMIKARSGWCYKVHGNEYTPSGIPDILGVYHGQFIGIETKMVGNTLSEIQRYRIARMRMAGAFVLAPGLTSHQVTEFLDKLDEMREGAVNAAIFVRAHYGIGADQNAG